MSVEFVFRLVGMVIFAIIGVQSIKLFQPSNPADSTRLIIALWQCFAGGGECFVWLHWPVCGDYAPA
jgi:hypothetical protein